jgi:hypothetical protein
MSDLYGGVYSSQHTVTMCRQSKVQRSKIDFLKRGLVITSLLGLYINYIYTCLNSTQFRGGVAGVFSLLGGIPPLQLLRKWTEKVLKCLKLAYKRIVYSSKHLLFEACFCKLKNWVIFQHTVTMCWRHFLLL